MRSSKPIKVLVVDDMAMVREILTKGLNMDPEIEVVATAPNPYIARDMIIKHNPDVMTLDVEMPRMDGVEFLRKLMPQRPTPTIMVSSLTERGKKITIDALQAGAIDFVAKPTSDVNRQLSAMIQELRSKVKVAAKSNVSHWKNKKMTKPSNYNISTKALAESTDKVIAIGASTGGTEAIKEVITKLPAAAPGVVIVQHMPAGFTKMFAQRLNTLSNMVVKEAEDGDRVMCGRILIAPGGSQLRVVRSGGVYKVKIEGDELCCGHCPSVEVMMQSVAEHVGSNAIGVMLTGMGADGADGMKAMRDAGARTIAQDEETSVVFGMPKEAYKRGGAEALVPLGEITNKILSLLETL